MPLRLIISKVIAQSGSIGLMILQRTVRECDAESAPVLLIVKSVQMLIHGIVVYASAEIAREALIAFASLNSNLAEVPALHDIPAKPFAQHPSSNLHVRLAVVGDKKLPGARDRSRFYLFNPEHDLAEQRRRNGRGRGNKYRDRDDGGYRSQRYDDREQQKREANNGFDASIYDDDEEALAKRSAQNRPRNYSHSPRDYSSGSDSRPRDRGRGERRRELFPVRDDEQGRLRNRSASPMQGNEWESRRDDVRLIERKRDMAVAANREKARLIKLRLKEGKELFPNKINTHHPRSNAFDADAVSDTADLFSDRMEVPFTDGANDERPLASRVTNQRVLGSSGFNIRGIAKTSQPQTFTIKGAGSVKELFPATLGDNSGKELFSGRLEGRGQRRQKAEDLFH